jgi:hypothetical protein
MIDEIGKRPPNIRRRRLGKIIGKIQPDIPDRKDLVRTERLKRRQSLAVAFVDFLIVDEKVAERKWSVCRRRTVGPRLASLLLNFKSERQHTAVLRLPYRHQTNTKIRLFVDFV